MALTLPGNQELPWYSPRNCGKHHVLPRYLSGDYFDFWSESVIIALTAFTKCSPFSRINWLIPIISHFKRLDDGTILLCPPLIGGGIKRWCCLMSVCLTCLSHTSGLSREQRGLGWLNWHRGSPRHTWLGHHFQCQKVKGQGHQAALLTVALTHQASAAVSMGTYWLWKPLLCCSLQAWRRFGVHRGMRGAGANRGGRPPTACFYQIM